VASEERVRPMPIPLLRAALAWAVALPICTLPFVLWLRRYGVPGDSQVLGCVGPLVALFAVERWLLRPGPVRHAKALRQLSVGNAGVMAIFSAASPVGIRLWPAIGLYAGSATLLLAAYVASSRVAPDGGVPRRLAEWAGWSVPDRAAAANLPVPWIKAARTWFLIWPGCLGLSTLFIWAASRSWLPLIPAAFIAYLISVDAVFGSKKTPRARNDKAARAVVLAGAPLYLIAMCGFGALDASPEWGIVIAVGGLTVAFAVSVAITHRPVRQPTASGVSGESDPPYPVIAPPV
jgi:hypothetical protein